MNKEFLEAQKRMLEARLALDVDPEGLDDKAKESRASDQNLLDHVNKELTDLEKRSKQDPDKDPDVIEIEKRHAELTSKVSLGEYLKHYGSGTPLPGGSAEAELNQELRMDSDFSVPLEALAPPAVEKRADAVTNVAAGGFGVSVDSILGRIFDGSDAAFMGVSFPSVPAGQKSYPVLTAGASGGMRSKNAVIDSEAATIAVVDVNATRASGRYVFAIEDLAHFSAELETALRTDLSAVLADIVSDQILNGSGVAPNVNGLLNKLTDPGDVTSEAAYADYISAITGGLGKTASSEAEVALLVGLGTYVHARSKMVTSTAVDAVAGMRSLGAGVKVSSHIGPKASSKQQAIRMTTGANGSLVVPVWQGVQVIRDNVSKANKGQICLTAHMLYNFAVKRTDGMTQLQFNIG